MNNKTGINKICRDMSFDSLLNKILLIKSNKNESFKAALYNFLIAFGICTFSIVCFILAPFVKPLFWAFLIGAFLFPFKRKLATLLNNWFERLEKDDINIFIAVSFAPVQTVEFCGRLLVNWIKKNWLTISSSFLILIFVKFIILYAPLSMIYWIWNMILLGNNLFSRVINVLRPYQVILFIILYLSTVQVLWTPRNAIYFSITAQIIWIILVGYACSYLGTLQIPIFLFLIVYCLFSVFYFVQISRPDLLKTHDTEVDGIKHRFISLLDKNVFKNSIDKVYQTYNELNTAENSFTESVSTNTEDNKDEKISDLYFKYLFYGCLITFFYRNIWMNLLGVIPMLFHLIFYFGTASGLWSFCKYNIHKIWIICKEWSFEHHSAILPLCLPGLLVLNHKMQTVTRNYLRSSVDLVTTIIMIIWTILVFVFVTVFFCINIYSETIEVAYLGKDLINKTITNRPDLIHFIPENMQGSIDNALDNAHSYGRQRIEQYITDLLKNVDPIHRENLKSQILNVWDRLIQFWFDCNKTDTFGPRIPTDALKSTISEIVDNPGYFKELVSVAKQGIIGWAKSNTDTILEVAESVWHIFRANISMIMGVTGGIFSVILSGGQAFIEFFLDMIVFFTAIFYLLSTSEEKYGPLKTLNYIGISSGSKLADALENSISGVLIALIKCSVFQGGFTWLIHTLLGARIVFLPSAIAAILSAAPFLGSYWCGVPAFLELWLAQDRFYSGIVLMMLLFFVPPYLEQEVHSEIKGGGHPYMTGLAIAGGLYWIGWQGAVLGPLVLCLFIGIFEVASVSIKFEDDKSVSEDENNT